MEMEMDRNIPLLLGLLPFFLNKEGSASRRRKKKKVPVKVQNQEEIEAKAQEVFQNIKYLLGMSDGTLRIEADIGTPDDGVAVFNPDDRLLKGLSRRLARSTRYYKSLGPDEKKRNETWLINLVINNGMKDTPTVFFEYISGETFILYASKVIGTPAGVDRMRSLLPQNSPYLNLMQLAEPQSYIYTLAHYYYIQNSETLQRIGITLDDLILVLQTQFLPSFVGESAMKQIDKKLAKSVDKLSQKLKRIIAKQEKGTR